MSAISLLEKLGVDPSVDLTDLTAEQQAEIAMMVASTEEEENKPTLSIYEPTDPDEDEEPAKEE